MVIGRVVRAILLVSAALALAACTRLAYMNAALAYDNATPMLAWMVGDYIDLTGEQRDWVRARLARAHSWHRAEELPQYRRFLEAALASAEDGVTPEEALAAQRDLRAGYHRLLDHLAPDLADFLLLLDAAQVAQLERRFADDNRKMVKESLEGSAKERHARRIKSYYTHIEEWIGDLTAAQRELVAERVRAMPEFFEERLAERRYRQREILALLRAKADRERMVAGLRHLLVDTDAWRRPEFTARVRERDCQLFEMIGALSLTLSPEQRVHFQARVRGYLRDIAELTAAS